jgi:hypothetical protein
LTYVGAEVGRSGKAKEEHILECDGNAGALVFGLKCEGKPIQERRLLKKFFSLAQRIYPGMVRVGMPTPFWKARSVNLTQAGWRSLYSTRRDG